MGGCGFNQTFNFSQSGGFGNGFSYSTEVVPPAPVVDIIHDRLQLWFDARYLGSYHGGTVWKDIASGRLATLHSGVTFDPVEKTMLFDCNGSGYADTPPFTADMSNGYTLEAYVRFDTLSFYNGVIAYNEPPHYANLEYYSSGVRFEGAGAQINDGHAPTLGKFYHYACTYDRSNISLYRDGALVVGPVPAAQPQSTTHTAPWVMGVWDGYLCGAITMTRLYTKALSPAEVLNNYNATLAGV